MFGLRIWQPSETLLMKNDILLMAGMLHSWLSCVNVLLKVADDSSVGKISKLITTPFMIPTGLPDGIFSNQKSQFGYILEGLAMEDVGILYGHLVFFVVI
jgi:hypothetical protein